MVDEHCFRQVSTLSSKIIVQQQKKLDFLQKLLNIEKFFIFLEKIFTFALQKLIKKMYPTISDFLNDIFGVNIKLPIQTYGFFVAMAYVCGGIFLYLEFKRYSKNGILPPILKAETIGKPAKPLEILLFGVFGFIIGYKIFEMIFHYSEFVENPQKFLLSSRGNFLGGILTGIVVAAVTFYDKHKQKLDKPKLVERQLFAEELVNNIVFIAAISGILGAKLFHNLENINDLIADPVDSLLSFSGLSFYGGLICGLGAVMFYIWKNKIPIPRFLDAVAPAIALAYSVGRMGCNVSGDGCWGIVNNYPKPSFLPEWAWAYRFPHNVVNEGGLIDNCSGKFCHILDQPVFPTSLYESTLMLIIFLILWFLRKKINIAGMLFSIYLILAGSERFFIELIRVNNTYSIFGFNITQAQLISTTSILLGIFGIFYLKRKQKLLQH